MKDLIELDISNGPGEKSILYFYHRANPKVYKVIFNEGTSIEEAQAVLHITKWVKSNPTLPEHIRKTLRNPEKVSPKSDEGLTRGK